MDIDYQVNLADAKAKIGNDVCIRGNKNTNLLGTSHSAEEIVKEITQNIVAGKLKGMYMYAAGCEWPWGPFDIAIRNLGIAKALNENMGRY